MKINKYKKICLMIFISIFLFLTLIMQNNKSYAEYGELFSKFLVMNGGSLANGKTTASIQYDKTYEIPYSLSFTALENFVNEKCKENGTITGSKVIEVFEEYSTMLKDEGDEKAKSEKEVKEYEALFQIMGAVKDALKGKNENESVSDALKKAGIKSEAYNSDGTIDNEQSSNTFLTKEELLNYNYDKLKGIFLNTDNYYDNGKKIKGLDDNSNLSESDKEEIKKKWAETYYKEEREDSIPNIDEYLKKQLDEIKATIYYRNLSVSTSGSTSGLDDMVSDSEAFINVADENRIETTSLQKFTQNIYNILLTIGIVVAVLAGAIIGIRYMLGSVEDKAEVKGMLIPYIAGCVIVFGAFAIWKIVVTILQRI